VQSNTLEQLVCFLPALFVAAVYWPPVYMAAIGVLYLVGQTLYWLSYVKDPKTNGTGFMDTFVSTAILIIAAIVAALFRVPI
jgi:ABC-type phosphate transport system permease subunit